MSKHITIDPVTRIEGHLRIDVEVGPSATPPAAAPADAATEGDAAAAPPANGSEVVNAWSAGTMWRGIEPILQGRNPHDAWMFTQRICGVCTTVHAIASVRAVENALGLEVPLNAQYIRNLMILGHALADHIVHFYILSALDWVDVTKALEADPAEAAKIGQSLSGWHRNSKEELAAVKAKLKGFVGQGKLGIFTNGYWGHPSMLLPPAVNLLAVSHYLQSIEYQRKANQIVAILGSKTPNIQNLAVGGVANAINLDNPATLNMEKLYQVKELFKEVREFVHNVYLPDAAAVAGLYADWTKYGAGVTNYMAVPELPLDTKGTQFDMPGGIIMGGKIDTYKPITTFGDEYFVKGVTESSARAWYADDGSPLHPWDGQTVPKPGEWTADGKYSWSKAPRFQGKPMQVGPLAQVLVAYAAGDPTTKKFADAALAAISKTAGATVGLEALHSTLGRIGARAVRAAVMAELADKHWGLLAANIGKGDTTIFTPYEYPKGEVKGMGFHEAPRGVLSHWIVIKDGKIGNYQAVVPSTWNLGPRDDKGQMSPVEASLMGNPIADSEKPLEALRTVHSFDPCLACAIHATDADGTTGTIIDDA